MRTAAFAEPGTATTSVNVKTAGDMTGFLKLLGAQPRLKLQQVLTFYASSP
jgi:hypothetical protein